MRTTRPEKALRASQSVPPVRVAVGGAGTRLATLAAPADHARIRRERRAENRGRSRFS